MKKDKPKLRNILQNRNIPPKGQDHEKQRQRNCHSPDNAKTWQPNTVSVAPSVRYTKQNKVINETLGKSQ